MSEFHKRPISQQDRRPHTLTASQLRVQHKRTQDIKLRRTMLRMLNEKPKLRGWIHAVTFPLCVAASIVLICLAPNGDMKVAVSIYGATAMLLFGVSATLHLGHGYFVPKVDNILVRLDYTNIFLIIAGTNTPFLFALQNVAVRWVYLGVVWFMAIVGMVAHLIWPDGLDWLFTIIYCVLGLAPFTIIWMFWTCPFIGPVPTILLICGGGCYIAGAVCFALRKPNPFPGWFGYHEIFHLGTVGGYVCHLIAIFMTVLAMH
ncbi:PAQR family membrane homeostasis protein TrhA [Bifidobacterium dolichotidis]|nr:hemolysin III family protein [Bifidobacterium dolichotidis]